ncbi:MAG: ABC transporter permease [Candidatus Limnocylindrales bacterium]|nr:ABC transporter permease [Candidatus Limnocylindrales bacterium]
MRLRPANVATIARREYLVRARTRSFRVATVFVVAAAILVTLGPLAVRWFDHDSTAKVGVHVGTTLAFDPVARLDATVNLPATPDGAGPFTFSTVADAAVGRDSVAKGDLSAMLDITRDPAGDLAFTIVSKDGPTLRVPTLLRQASSVLATTDRLLRGGYPADQLSALGIPPAVTVEGPTPAAPGEKPKDFAGEVGGALTGQALVIFLFIAIVLYGQWVAMSVAEEKSSRVMEIVLNAASPFELLAGKVIGVGALGLTQYVAAMVPAVVAFLLQDRIASLLLGAAASTGSAASGLSTGLLVAFAVLFVLGFLLYAVLYAAAGSLVSRVEDINSVVAPMTMVGMAGYFIAVYTASGLIPADAGWVVVLSYVPFVSPYLMLSRFAAGQAGALDLALASGLLVVAIVVCLWVAARIYAAGVLTHGQKPGARALFTAAFASRR